jgi:hypothetical protein
MSRVSGIGAQAHLQECLSRVLGRVVEGVLLTHLSFQTSAVRCRSLFRWRLIPPRWRLVPPRWRLSNWLHSPSQVGHLSRRCH